MTQEEIARRERLNILQDRGIDPYPSECKRTHTLGEVLDCFPLLFEKKTAVTCVGRVRLIRKHGGLTFVRLEDFSAVMQLALHRDQIGENNYQAFHEIVDIADFLEISGIVFYTKKGEPTLDVQTYKILAKSLRPLPEKWHGLTDVEARYRERELDLLANADVKKRFIARANVISSMRQFLNHQGFLEVETPILQLIPGGASARPFVTHHNTLDVDLYLRIAPELYLKRLIVGGFEKIFEIGRCFRNEGIDYAHNPEFTMLELYWAFVNKEVFVKIIEDLFSHIIHEAIDPLGPQLHNTNIKFDTPFLRLTFAEAILSNVGIDIQKIDKPEMLESVCREKQIGVNFDGCVGMGEYFDELWKQSVRSMIEQPTWIFDYPIELKPLAKKNDDDPTKSASAQLVIQGAEIVNAYYHELNDPIDQRKRFMEQQFLREKGSEEAQWMDEDFLRALEHGMPPTSGFGIGIDRLVACLTNAPNLKEVILFPTLKPKNESEDV